MSYLVFLKDLYLVTFCDEIKIENFKKSPKNIKKEATYRTAIHMKYSSKILKRRIVSKK